eukprot:CAMPEP_0198155220 /NCGR_PEP_ID=MMETSP1443-20131203/69021_1 /TAXON_ID=186043 /ORGANISM="Entomoneis sp., Strain CCMP2396" /LENGTH=370 /DNA_ID=CAMNT_0043821961 /DNA_START=31 /DNA_END=1143 /DNA_ORIENTATION=+
MSPKATSDHKWEQCFPEEEEEDRIITMPPKATSDRKRKQAAEVPEAVVSSDDQSNRKARRRSTDASVSAVASCQTTEEATVADAARFNSMESIGKMIQDLFDSDNAKVNAALDTLDLDLSRNKNKCEKIQAVGGCLALVQLLKLWLEKAIAIVPACDQVAELNELAELTTLKNTLYVIISCLGLVQLLKSCLEKAIDIIPACDQVAELNELAELTTLKNTLYVIISLTFQHDESRDGISAIGGVEAVVKIMKTFPKCQQLQKCAIDTLGNLAACGIGKKKVVESGGIEVLLSAVTNNFNSASICENACWVMANLVCDSNENTGLLISLGGATAVAKVRTKWSDNDEVLKWVRILAKWIGREMNSWADEKA